MQSAGALARGCAVAALAVGYILIAHYTNISPGRQALGTAVALMPLILAALSSAWRAPQRLAMLTLLAACAGLLGVEWARVEPYYSTIYWSEHAGTQMLLCMVFARTLAVGREPMCSRFARMVHGALTPASERYTRQVTAAWVIFFAMMATVSTVLFFIAPLRAWSTFANFFTAPLTCTMFIAEYAVRRTRHLGLPHAPFMAAVKAFYKASGNR